jgi:hypothetical protein
VVTSRKTRRAILPILAVAALGCDAGFDDAAIVVDLRILGMRAEPPEVIVPFNPDDPAQLDISAIPDIEVCALVADPGARRGLRYEMAVCPPPSDGRCAPSPSPVIPLEGGEVEDPERAAGPIVMCSTLPSSGDLFAVLQESIRADDLAGFGVVSVQVALRVTPEDGSEEVFGGKRVRFAPEQPAGRTGNQNPSLEGVTGIRAATGERGLDFDLPLGRCGEIEPWPVSPGERVTLLPREPDGAREAYVVPTFDGGSRSFTENLRYQWLATTGDFSRNNTGGELDVAGNSPPLDTRWLAPDDPDEVGGGLEVRMWIVQRDERGGQAWYESCARVIP